MKNHTKIYLKSLGYDLSDFIPSELTGEKAVDIHHIIGRGKCGEDRIENLMALTRKEHIFYGDKKKYMKHLLINHRLFLQANGVKFCNKWFIEQLERYED